MSNTATEDEIDPACIIAIFATINGGFIYFLESDRNEALQSFIAENREDPKAYPANLM